ncbi:hypothetical protein TRM7557_00556 [Tritonibacter multivorans]|uniref:Uncharacterized protein n=1 Tax=Tritonibacter multivorans TaxID=928856 RepID=A0A0P1G1W2_9RHOB|nr:hypothetical protein TRM7557_00556 [Tritonibacter multivorans]
MHATAIRGSEFLAWSYRERAFYVRFTAQKDLTCTGHK